MRVEKHCSYLLTFYLLIPHFNYFVFVRRGDLTAIIPFPLTRATCLLDARQSKYSYQRVVWFLKQFKWYRSFSMRRTRKMSSLHPNGGPVPLHNKIIHKQSGNTNTIILNQVNGFQVNGMQHTASTMMPVCLWMRVCECKTFIDCSQCSFLLLLFYRQVTN